MRPGWAWWIIGLFSCAALLSLGGLLPISESERVAVTYLPPGAGHWLGTDFLGRDVLAKVIAGAKVAFAVGLSASALAIPIGAALGVMAGYFGGRVDDLVVWLYSSLSSIPQILLLTALSFVLGKGLGVICVAIGLTSWVGICRLLRAEVMRMKGADFIAAVKVLGGPGSRVLRRHILPNVAHLILIDFSLRFVYAIKAEAILSYLGLGVQGRPSWGTMIADSKEELLNGVWWQLAGATVALFLLAFAFNAVGDELRDRFDPRIRRSGTSAHFVQTS